MENGLERSACKKPSGELKLSRAGQAVKFQADSAKKPYKEAMEVQDDLGGEEPCQENTEVQDSVIEES